MWHRTQNQCRKNKTARKKSIENKLTFFGTYCSSFVLFFLFTPNSPGPSLALKFCVKIAVSYLFDWEGQKNIYLFKSPHVWTWRDTPHIDSQIFFWSDGKAAWRHPPRCGLFLFFNVSWLIFLTIVSTFIIFFFRGAETGRRSAGEANRRIGTPRLDRSIFYATEKQLDAIPCGVGCFAGLCFSTMMVGPLPIPSPSHQSESNLILVEVFIKLSVQRLLGSRIPGRLLRRSPGTRPALCWRRRARVFFLNCCYCWCSDCIHCFYGSKKTAPDGNSNPPQNSIWYCHQYFYMLKNTSVSSSSREPISESLPHFT